MTPQPPPGILPRSRRSESRLADPEARRYVHLHVHSSYSLLEGALKIGDLVKAAGADRQPALALTDTNNLFGALEFSEKAAGSGIQPIAGMQLSVAFERRKRTPS